MSWRVFSVVIGILVLLSGFALAQDQERTQDKVWMQTQEQGQIYGSQLMTAEERAEYQARMRAARTQAEREQIRREHHERMRQRATERGVTLPEEPPVQGGGMMRQDGRGPATGGRGAGGRGPR
jgi:hypothetical protein